jgi:hypothetical protein
MRACPTCGDRLPLDAAPARTYCSDACRFAATTPARSKAPAPRDLSPHGDAYRARGNDEAFLRALVSTGIRWSRHGSGA